MRMLTRYQQNCMMMALQRRMRSWKNDEFAFTQPDGPPIRWRCTHLATGYWIEGNFASGRLTTFFWSVADDRRLYPETTP